MHPFGCAAGSSFPHGSRFRKPPSHPGRSDFPSPVGSQGRGMVSPSSLPIGAEAQVLAHIHPSRRSFTGWRALGSVDPVLPGPTGPGGVSSLAAVLVPRAPSPWAGVTRSVSLLRAHAPDLNPLCSSLDALSHSLCRLLRAPAGLRPFPTLSLHIFPCVLGPLPRRLLRCMDPCLPPRHRPSPREDRVGAPQSPCSDFSTAPFSRLQSFLDVQARRCAHHPGRSYRYGIRRMAAVVSPSEPLVVRYLPTPRICSPSESGN